MNIALATDEDRAVVETIAAHLRARGHSVVRLPTAPWANVASQAAQAVARGDVDQAVVCCWTGTGACIAANKIAGIRAALCTDAATAAGARAWNDANVLALSLRLVSEPVAAEILDAWLDATYKESENENLDVIRSLE